MGLSCYGSNVIALRAIFGFNALMGLSCYKGIQGKIEKQRGFNALMGLSCYICNEVLSILENLFQCPYGLELLRQECPIF